MLRPAFPLLRRLLGGAALSLALGAAAEAAPVKVYAAGSLSGAMAALIEDDHADLFLCYCSSSAGLLKAVPDLTSLPLPESLEVHPVHGMAVLSQDPAAERFALFVLSLRGQAILKRFGFEPLAAPDRAAAARAAVAVIA